jgi:hypothetical protein
MAEKHARKIDDKRRVILPEEFPPGETVVLQPIEPGVYILSVVKGDPRHFAEADTDGSESWEMTAKDIESFYDPDKAW